MDVSDPQSLITPMRHGCTVRFVITSGAGRGLTDGLAEPQSAPGSRWENLHRMQYFVCAGV